MRIREYLKTFGWGYFIISCIIAIYFIYKASDTSIKDLTGLYVFISFGLLLNGSMILSVFIALENIMDRLSTMFGYIKDNDKPDSGIKTVIIEHNHTGGRSGNISTN
jgi:hypothetical protein